jgi:hypothetical protein
LHPPSSLLTHKLRQVGALHGFHKICPHLLHKKPRSLCQLTQPTQTNQFARSRTQTSGQHFRKKYAKNDIVNAPVSSLVYSDSATGRVWARAFLKCITRTTL